MDHRWDLGDAGLACPLLVGFAGDRDLGSAQAPALRNTFQHILEDLQARYPHTPLVVLVGLATDTGRLAAQIAIDNGIAFIAVLPHDSDEATGAVSSPDARRDCESLLRHAIGILPLPGVSSSSGPHGAGAEGAEAGINATTRYLFEKSHVLVALWDGQADAQSDSVGAVIQEWTGISPVASPFWQFAGCADVLHVKVGSIDECQSSSRYEIVRIPPRASYLCKLNVIDSITRCNADLARLRSHMEQPLRTSRSYLWSEDITTSESLSLLRNGFATFDVLANRWQKASRFLTNLFFGFSWAAVLFLQLCSGSTRSHFSVGGYLGCLAVAWVCFLWLWHRKHQTQHLDYRAIAESLRVQFFWRLAGIQADVADRYPAAHQPIVAWVRSALSTITVIADALRRGPASAPTIDTLRAVEKAWLHDQARYFTRASSRDRTTLRFRKYIVTACFAVGSLLTIIFVLKGSPDWLSLGIGVLMATGALIAGHTEALALEEHTNQYSHMASLFESSRDAFISLLASDDRPAAINLLQDVGHEAVGESIAWILLHTMRPLRAPK